MDDLDKPSLDFEYTIHDASGIRGIKEGKEYPISREEWRIMRPEHKTTGCKECEFVRNIEILLVYVISRDMREKARAEPKFVGKFTMPDWTGHSSFYLFKCKGCKAVVIDYLHGYRDGYLYLFCGCCHREIILKPRKYRKVYERDNVYIPQDRSL